MTAAECSALLFDHPEQMQAVCMIGVHLQNLAVNLLSLVQSPGVMMAKRSLQLVLGNFLGKRELPLRHGCILLHREAFIMEVLQDGFPTRTTETRSLPNKWRSGFAYA